MSKTKSSTRARLQTPGEGVPGADAVNQRMIGFGVAKNNSKSHPCADGNFQWQQR